MLRVTFLAGMVSLAICARGSRRSTALLFALTQCPPTARRVQQQASQADEEAGAAALAGDGISILAYCWSIQCLHRCSSWCASQIRRQQAAASVGCGTFQFCSESKPFHCHAQVRQQVSQANQEAEAAALADDSDSHQRVVRHLTQILFHAPRRCSSR